MIEKYLRKKITRTDLETRVLNISLQSRYAILGGLSEEVKKELRIKDSIAQSKLKKVAAQKIDTTKTKK